MLSFMRILLCAHEILFLTGAETVDILYLSDPVMRLHYLKEREMCYENRT